MKKILLAGTAIVGAAVLAAPAQADLKLDLGGHFRGYAVYADQDEDTGAGATLDNFGFTRDMEVQFQGETTTDSGLTVGAHAELDLGNAGYDTGSNIQTVQSFLNNGAAGTAGGVSSDGDMLDEAYLYFSGGWGRVNFGSEDGAAYLLQVAAPSADSNVDGMRVYVQALNSDVWDDGAANGTVNEPVNNYPLQLVLGYDNAQFRNTERLTYLTPKWNGFQAGLSYAPEAGQTVTDGALLGMGTDDTDTTFENLWEAAARWDGEFEGFGISLGVGYASASAEDDGTPPVAGAFGSDDISSWDAGLNVSFNDFSIGAAYLNQETGTDDVAAGPDSDIETWVVGAAWDNGPYHLGATWYNTEIGSNVYGTGLAAAADTIDIDRWTVGGGYTYGPGMTFRGSVAFGSVDNGGGVGASEPDFVQVAIGTDVNF